MRERSGGGDVMARMQALSASVLIASGAGAIVGSFLDWVTLRPAGPVDLEEFDDVPFEVENVSRPFTGVEAGDGWVVVIAASFIVLGGLLVALRGRGAWIALLGAIVVGAIAVAAYRGIADPTARLSEKMGLIGRADPAFGLILVAACGVVALLASVVASAATPRRETSSGNVP